MLTLVFEFTAWVLCTILIVMLLQASVGHGQFEWTLDGRHHVLTLGRTNR